MKKRYITLCILLIISALCLVPLLAACGAQTAANQSAVTVKGDKGDSGEAGATGAVGPAGPTGATGAVGSVGQDGADGERGSKGAKGSIGATGAVGPAGPTGATGATGPAGAQGVPGPAGTQGIPGPTGAQGIPGPTGAQGIPGPAGTQGPTGPQGMTGTIGLSEYAYIYNLDAQVVALEAGILFSNNGVMVGTITHAAGTSEIRIGSAGNYAIWFNVSGVEPNQFALCKNGNPVSGSIYGSGAGTQENSGMVIITADAHDVLTVRNHTSTAAVTLQTLDGGTEINSNASILIQKISE